MQFDNMTGLYALLSLIPLILAYLRRPRPQDKSIPSLMFIMKSTGMSTSHRIFRKLFQNIIFFLQFLALVMLSVAVAVPYMDVETKYIAKHTVIVIDISASMQAGDRFNDAITAAKQNIGNRNSVIVFSQNPYIAGTDLSPSRTEEILNQLRPTEGVSNLGSAMLAAEAVFNESGGRVVVVSDFISTLGVDPNEAKRILLSKGFDVEFYPVGKDEKNVGIIDIDVRNDKTTAVIKNYNDNTETVIAKLMKDGNEVDAVEVHILPYSVESVTFATLPGKSMIEIDPKDGFDVDDRVYVSSPVEPQTDVLLITNERDSNLEIALRASPRIRLDVQEPPKVTIGNHKVFIFYGINPNILLPGNPDLVSRRVNEGASSIIVAQEGIGMINWFDIMPVTLGEPLNSSTINVDVFNKFSRYLQKGEAGKYMTSSHFFATANERALVIATSDADVPLIAMEQIGKGKAVYYGISEEDEFILSPDYPVFWNNMVEFLVERGDIADYNKRFTDFYTINVTKQGVYDIGGKDIAINLLDEKESDVRKSGVSGSSVIARDASEFHVDEETLRGKYFFDSHLIWIVLALFALEIFFLKYRGDI